MIEIHYILIYVCVCVRLCMYVRVRVRVCLRVRVSVPAALSSCLNILIMVKILSISEIEPFQQIKYV